MVTGEKVAPSQNAADLKLKKIVLKRPTLLMSLSEASTAEATSNTSSAKVLFQRCCVSWNFLLSALKKNKQMGSFIYLCYMDRIHDAHILANLK